MAVMSMNKVIHGAFRRDLDRFLTTLAAFTDGDHARAARLGVAWDNFDDQLTDHHEGEHEIAWPALESVGVSRELLDRLDVEHNAMAAALTQTRSAMTAFRSSASSADAETARASFEKLKEATLSHFEHEEAELEPVYQAHAEGPEMKAMGRKFGQVSPARGGRFFAWVTDGATPEETEAITAMVPKPVLKILGGIFGRSYRRDVAPVWRSA